jgi:hypothetical protein
MQRCVRRWDPNFWEMGRAVVEFGMGVSGLGYCLHAVRRKVPGLRPEDRPGDAERFPLPLPGGRQPPHCEPDLAAKMTDW